LRLYFSAILPGGAVPNKVDVRITPTGQTRDGSGFQSLPTLPEMPLTRDPVTDDQGGGVFDFPLAVTQKIDNLIDSYSLKSLSLKIEFVPSLSDTTQLPKKTLILER
jgi:hypothetical protein